MSKQTGYLKVSQSGSSHRTSVFAGVLATVIALTGLGGWAVAQEADKISKFLMIKISRDQSQVLCQSEVFTSCMGFTEQACFDLSEKALRQCIVPLPDTVLLQDLDAEVLEICPQEVYKKAGYSNDKATACLAEAMKN